MPLPAVAAPAAPSEASPIDIDKDKVREALKRVLSSHAFGAAESQKAFLHYVVEQALTGVGGKIKEYEIATEVFGKASSFDSRIDPIVRTQATNLRARITKYYETEGRQDAVRIYLPKGGYTPEFKVLEVSQPVLDQRDIEHSEAVVPPDIDPAIESVGDEVHHSRRKALIVMILGSVLLSSTVGWFVFHRQKSPPSDLSVVVLPFSNLSETREGEIFSDGLTDELIDSLARVPKLRVIGRTSAFQFRNKDIDIREIGQKLGVSAVLEGSVRRYGERIRITAQLTDSRSRTVLWSDNYESDASDALIVQKEIARAITIAFKGRLPLPVNMVTAPTQSNDKLPEDYLKARFFWAKNTPKDLSTAIDFLQSAIRENPNYAPNYLGLVQCYASLPNLTGTRSKDVIPEIRSAALKALSLDPNQGGAHTGLAIAAMYGFDWATAEREFRIALALSPGGSNGHQAYSNYLQLTGRTSEAVEQSEIALRIDPISPNFAQALAKSLRIAGRLDDSISQAKKALALDSQYGMSHEVLGIDYVEKGMYAEGIADLEHAHELLGDSPGPVSNLAYAYARAGRIAEARQMLQNALKQFDQGTMPAVAIARMYVGLGDSNRAIEWLSKAIDRQDINIFLKSDPIYEPIRKDSHYPMLLKSMKLSIS